MRKPKLLTLLSALLISGAGYGADTLGLKDFGTPGAFTTWQVYSCPDDVDCKVSVGLTVSAAGCEISAVDFIDRHPHQKKQTIVWQIAPNSTYDVQFRGDGIKMTDGGQDVDDVKKDAKEHKKKVKQKSQTFLLYDILLEYKPLGSATPYLPCIPKGPAIVNRD